MKLLGLIVRLFLVGAVLGGAALIYLDATVQHRFDHARWDVPARVYSRALELYPSPLLTVDRLLAELSRLGYDMEGDLARPGSARHDGDLVRIHRRAFAFEDANEPARRFTVRVGTGGVTSILDDNGESIELVRLEPLQIGSIHPLVHEDRVLLTLAEVPELLRNALLLIEDREFYVHGGVQPRAILRAALTNLRAGRITQGGSTITQQLMKNLYLSADRTYWRKGLEAMMAMLVELHYTKAEILEAYVNEIYLAQDGNRAIHGFGLASQHFFGKRVDELDLHEMALLVGLIRGPSLYEPSRNPERAKERRNLVLDRLLARELITEAEWRSASAAPLLPPAGKEKVVAGPYLALVKRQLASDYSREDLNTKGLRIYTGFDPEVQQVAQRRLTAGLDAIAADRKMPDSLNGAAIVARVGTGEVQAVVGDRRAGRAGFNRALDARRAIGSLVKPVVVAAALEGGGRSLATRVSDDPVKLAGKGRGDAWTPRNFDRKSHGTVSILEALVKSYNQATVRLGLDVGVRQVAARLEAMSDISVPGPLPSLLLGSIEMTPLEVVDLYHTIASGGYRTPVRAIRAVAGPDGRIEKRFPLTVERVLSPEVAHMLHFGLLEVVGSGTASVGATRDLPRLAGKTGTTNDYRDSWFAGYGDDLLAVVWLGADDNQPVGLTGSGGALVVWAAIMGDLPVKASTRALPTTLVERRVNLRTGKVVGRRCRDALLIPLPKDLVPPRGIRCE